MFRENRRLTKEERLVKLDQAVDWYVAGKGNLADASMAFSFTGTTIKKRMIERGLKKEKYNPANVFGTNKK